MKVIEQNAATANLRALRSRDERLITGAPRAGVEGYGPAVTGGAGWTGFGIERAAATTTLNQKIARVGLLLFIGHLSAFLVGRSAKHSAVSAPATLDPESQFEAHAGKSAAVWRVNVT